MLTLAVHGDADTPATDLGFLLRKHPQRVQQFPTSQGTATVLFPVADDQTCRLLFHVDGAQARLDRDDNRHVNTVAYAASSRLCVALGKVFGDALAGRCSERPELVNHEWPVEVVVPSVPLSVSVDPADLFEPLGWHIECESQPLTPAQWGDSEFVTLRLTGRHSVVDTLRHLAVLLPVMAGGKHYFVDEAEVDKLESFAAQWLPNHPKRDVIVGGYTKHVRALGDLARERLGMRDDGIEAEGRGAPRPSLASARRDAVAGLLRESGARTVLDVGCGEGRLLADLAGETGYTRLAGTDVSAGALDAAETRISRWRHVEVWQSSLAYADDRCRGFDAVVLMEVIEHIDLDRLPSAVAAVFAEMAPPTVVVTTPNRDYNRHYGLDDQRLRHPDHRFEFTRAEFTEWCDRVCSDHRYIAELGGIGPTHPDDGPSTQYALFTREEVTS